jgi:hypothetical protein
VTAREPNDEIAAQESGADGADLGTEASLSLSRRDALRLAAGAAAALPLSGLALAAPAAAVPAFFTTTEMALLDVLTELIIPTDEHSPGARAAGVAGYIDRRLAEYDPALPELREARDQWKSGLRALDALAKDVSGSSFLQAEPSAQEALLARLAAKEENPQTEGERFFGELKRWTARGYYTSKIGIHDEMEYKGNTLQTEYAGIDVALAPPAPSGD